MGDSNVFFKQNWKAQSILPVFFTLVIWLSIQSSLKKNAIEMLI
jgi:hypothetical protein